MALRGGYVSAIFGPPKAAAPKPPAPKPETWSHVHPDGSHVASARLADGRVIRVIGMPGGERDPYKELRGWLQQK